MKKFKFGTVHTTPTFGDPGIRCDTVQDMLKALSDTGTLRSYVFVYDKRRPSVAKSRSYK